MMTTQAEVSRFYFWLGVCVLAGILLVAPHLGDAVWQDEAYTLLNFSSHGLLYPFTDYHLPNNHILLSVWLASWWTPGDSVIDLRWPLLFIFASGSTLLAWATARNFGRSAAIITTLLFSCSSITANFALQLRGYGPSWFLVALMLWAFLAYRSRERWVAGLVYSLSGALLLALIPTNVMIYGVFVAWGWLLAWLVPYPDSSRGKYLVLITCGPLPGLIAYVNVWDQVLALSGLGFSEWTRTAAVAELATTFYVEYWILLPLMLAGFFFVLTQALRWSSQARVEILLILTLFAIPAVTLFMLQQAPFPRNLVPLLPLVCLVSGIGVARGMYMLLNKETSKGMLALAVLVAISFVVKTAWIGCDEVSDIRNTGNLCRPYYQQGYRPESVARYILDHAPNHRPPVVTGFEGVYALGFLNLNYGLGINLYDHPAYLAVGKRNHRSEPQPWVVVGAHEAPIKVFEALQVEANSYRLALDSGYFTLYQPVDSFDPGK